MKLEYFNHVEIVWSCSFLRELHALRISFLIFQDNLPSYYSLKGCTSQVSESEFKELEDGKTWSILICRTSFFLARTLPPSEKPKIRIRKFTRFISNFVKRNVVNTCHYIICNFVFIETFNTTFNSRAICVLANVLIN